MPLPSTNPNGTQSCIYYFCHLDENGDPIPGTMYGTPNRDKIDKGYKCRELAITGGPVPVPNGYVQCRNGLRYWYQVESVPTGAGNSRNVIVPNSLIAVKGVPAPLSKMGTGGRPCQYMELPVYKPINDAEIPEPFENLEVL